MRYFCKFCHHYSVPVPCLPDNAQDEQNLFVVIYASLVAMGHTLLYKIIKPNTIQLYFKAAVCYIRSDN
eukprot:7578628-Ditylum_brightwellii.AAC.1